MVECADIYRLNKLCEASLLLLVRELNGQQHFNTLTVNLEDELPAMRVLHCSIQVVDQVHLLAIYLKEDVTHFHICLPSRRLCVHQQHHHARLVHH